MVRCAIRWISFMINNNTVTKNVKLGLTVTKNVRLWLLDDYVAPAGVLAIGRGSSSRGR